MKTVDLRTDAWGNQHDDRVYLNGDLTNNKYHGNRTHVSSSGLKLVYYDPSKYKEKYIDGVSEPSSDAMNFGTYIHTMILEPEKLDEEFTVFPGARKFGKAWDEFKAKHSDKLIINANQYELAKLMKAGFDASEYGPLLLRSGVAETSYFTVLDGLPVKVRTDFETEDGRIVDLKTTSSELTEEEIQKVIKRFGYHISAALYVDVIKQVTGVEKPFYLSFLSKAGSCNAYTWRVSDEAIAKGRKAYKAAIARLIQCKNTGNWNKNPLDYIPEISLPEKES